MVEGKWQELQWEWRELPWELVQLLWEWRELPWGLAQVCQAGREPVPDWTRRGHVPRAQQVGVLTLWKIVKQPTASVKSAKFCVFLCKVVSVFSSRG